MNTFTISRYELDENGIERRISEDEYRRRYQEACSTCSNKVKVDDGNGGIAWKFFESAYDMDVWKNQK